MKRKIDSQRVFQQIRNLPLEVPFGKVETWIVQQPLNVTTQQRWLPYFLVNWWKKWSEN